MTMRHKLCHFTIANTCFTALLMHRSKINLQQYVDTIYVSKSFNHKHVIPSSATELTLLFCGKEMVGVIITTNTDIDNVTIAYKWLCHGLNYTCLIDKSVCLNQKYLCEFDHLSLSVSLSIVTIFAAREIWQFLFILLTLIKIQNLLSKDKAFHN